MYSVALLCSATCIGSALSGAEQNEALWLFNAKDSTFGLLVFFGCKAQCTSDIGEGKAVRSHSKTMAPVLAIVFCIRTAYNYISFIGRRPCKDRFARNVFLCDLLKFSANVCDYFRDHSKGAGPRMLLLIQPVFLCVFLGFKAHQPKHHAQSPQHPSIAQLRPTFVWDDRQRCVESTASFSS